MHVLASIYKHIMKYAPILSLEKLHLIIFKGLIIALSSWSNIYIKMSINTCIFLIIVTKKIYYKHLHDNDTRNQTP